MNVQLWALGHNKLVVPADPKIPVLVRLDPKELNFQTDGDLKVASSESLAEATQGVTEAEAYFRLCLAFELRVEEFRDRGSAAELSAFLRTNGWSEVFSPELFAGDVLVYLARNGRITAEECASVMPKYALLLRDEATKLLSGMAQEGKIRACRDQANPPGVTLEPWQIAYELR